MHCQKPLCLKALSFFRYPSLVNGSFSKKVLSLFKYLNISGSKIKKPPFIHPSSNLDFSLKYLTLLPEIFIAPNLAGGLTAVSVARPLLFI